MVNLLINFKLLCCSLIYYLGLFFCREIIGNFNVFFVSLMYGEFSKGCVWAVYAGMQSGDGQTREWKGYGKNGVPDWNRTSN